MHSQVEKIQQVLWDRGVSAADWARENGFKVRTVYAVMRGELKGRRGISHQILVALGIKDQPNRGQNA